MTYRFPTYHIYNISLVDIFVKYISVKILILLHMLAFEYMAFEHLIFKYPAFEHLIFEYPAFEHLVLEY